MHGIDYESDFKAYLNNREKICMHCLCGIIFESSTWEDVGNSIDDHIMSSNLTDSKINAKTLFTGTGQAVHIVPVSGPAHNTDAPEGPDCWCVPTKETVDNGNYLLIHRLMS